MANDNLAYDFSLFEPREERPPRRKTVRVVKAPGAKRAAVGDVFRWSAAALVLTFSLVMLMMSQVRLTELNDRISSAKQRLSAAQSEQIRLNMELESRMSLVNVENYAVNKLGMQKLQSYQIHYINMNNTDRVVVNSAAANTPQAALRRIVARVLEYFQ